MYERLEDFAETLDYAQPGERDKALHDYLKALHAVAASRTRVEQDQARERAEKATRRGRIEAAAAATDMRIVKPLPAGDHLNRSHTKLANTAA
ncbi:hypothetical protein [Nocardia africana]